MGALHRQLRGAGVLPIARLWISARAQQDFVRNVGQPGSPLYLPSSWAMGYRCPVPVGPSSGPLKNSEVLDCCGYFFPGGGVEMLANTVQVTNS